MNDQHFAVTSNRLDWQISNQQAQIDRLTERVRTARPAPTPSARPRRQSAIKERLDKMTEYEWSALADKSRPLPAGLAGNEEQLTRELSYYLLAQYGERWGL